MRGRATRSSSCRFSAHVEVIYARPAPRLLPRPPRDHLPAPGGDDGAGGSSPRASGRCASCSTTSGSSRSTSSAAARERSSRPSSRSPIPPLPLARDDRARAPAQGAAGRADAHAQLGAAAPADRRPASDRRGLAEEGRQVPLRRGPAADLRPALARLRADPGVHPHVQVLGHAARPLLRPATQGSLVARADAARHDRRGPAGDARAISTSSPRRSRTAAACTSSPRAGGSSTTSRATRSTG